MKTYILIDIGGTAIKYGLLDEEENLYFKDSIPTESEKGGPQIYTKVVMLTDRLLQKCGRENAAGICISSAGMVDTEEGTIFHSGPTIPDYKGTRFKEPLEERFHLPCEIENDVNCAGLAEYISGAGKGASSMLCLTVGTGIGGCAVTGGEILHGFTGSGCEVGYMHMRGSTFEELGAASVLTRKVAQAKNDDPAFWDGIRVFEAAGRGDTDAVRAIDEMCDVLGEGIANICYVLNPEIVVLGGGIMAQEEYLCPRIRQALGKYLIPVIADHTGLAVARMGNDAGMIGAYYHFRQMQKKRKAVQSGNDH